jgi:hypothetical protein
MKLARALRYIALGLALAYAFPAACGSGGVVGGECKDSRNCRATGEGGDGQGTNPKGGSLNFGGATAEGGNGAAAMPQGGDNELPDGSIFDSPVDGASDADAPLMCLPPHDSPLHCGDCDTQCMAPTPLCAPDGNGSFECVPLCEPPLVECRGQCLDPDSFLSDPDNCGKCGNECASDICQAGKCVGAKYGNVALICMDFNANDRESSATSLLGNAIFLPAKNPVKVLAYTRGASAAAVARVNTVIGWEEDARGRTASITEAKTVDSVTNTLNINDYQVLLIHDLDEAKSGDPAAAATTWESGSVLSSFAKAGGVIIVIDGGDGTGEMHELINAGNLLDPTGQVTIDGQTEITGDVVWNNAPGDALGSNLLVQSLATSHTCTFDTAAKASSELVFVLSDDPDDGAPVAIHRVIAP